MTGSDKTPAVSAAKSGTSRSILATSDVVNTIVNLVTSNLYNKTWDKNRRMRAFREIAAELMMHGYDDRFRWSEITNDMMVIANKIIARNK